MWRVSALDRDGREIAQLEIASGELTIGRDTDRQLVLPSASVSRRHARIVIEGGRPVIVDEGSSNGVLINGVRISGPTPVGPAMRIEVAEFRISIEPLTPRRAEPVASAPVSVPRVVSPPAGMRLIAEGGPYDGRVFDLPAGQIAVGRAVDNDLVFDDPSLSRRHARLRREGSKLDLEDLGSSNGTFVNGRRVGNGSAGPGDVVRFGDLSFRCEGGEHGSTRSVEPGLPRPLLYGLAGGGSATVLILILAIVFLARKTPTVQASGREAISRLQRQAESHFSSAKQLYQQRKYPEAKVELDQGLDLDPANLEARRLRALTLHGADDDRALTSGSASLAIGDHQGLESALRSYADITEGASQRAQLYAKLAPALFKYGDEMYQKRAWGESAWALCRAFELLQTSSIPGQARERPPLGEAQKLRDAERRNKRGPVCAVPTP